MNVRFLSLLRVIRPRQWAKNFIIYFAFIFSVHEWRTVGEFGEGFDLFSLATYAFLLFCLLSSGIYIINDIADVSQDRIHPWKRYRPIASGSLSILPAVVLAFLLIVGSLSAAYTLDTWLGLLTTIYVILAIAYSFLLKRIPMIDVLVLSGGYVLRAAAGAVIISAPISPWLYIVTGLGAMLIGFGKRRKELEGAGDVAVEQRVVFHGYSITLLDQLIAVVVPSTLIAYILYTFTGTDVEGNLMMISIPFVVYGLFRYLWLIYKRDIGESPGEELLTDRPLMATVVFWLATVIVILSIA